jgi:hypothetical protein
MLMYHPYPFDYGIVGGIEKLALSVDTYGSGIGGVNPRKHIYQGTLSGAVLAQEGDNFTAVYLYADIIVGQYGIKPF